MTRPFICGFFQKEIIFLKRASHVMFLPTSSSLSAFHSRLRGQLGRQSLSGRSDLPADHTGTFESAAQPSLAEASDEGCAVCQIDGTVKRDGAEPPHVDPLLSEVVCWKTQPPSSCNRHTNRAEERRAD